MNYRISENSVLNSKFNFILDELLKEHNKLYAIIDQLDDGILVTDPKEENNPIVFANSGFLQLTQYSSEEVLGKNCRFLQGEKTDKNTIMEIRDAIKNRSTIKTEILNYKKDGTPFWNELKISPIFDDSGEILYFVGIQSDVTIRKNAQEMALYDSLTSIPNRRYLFHELKDRIGNGERFAVLVLDIDHFKEINDSMGHIVGDDLLVEVSNRLKNSLPDLFTARYGGDEFVMMLPLPVSLKALDEMIKTILSKFTNSFYFCNQENFIHVSLGVAITPDDGGSAEELIKKADLAMYEAKKTKGNSYCYYSITTS